MGGVKGGGETGAVDSCCVVEYLIWWEHGRLVISRDLVNVKHFGITEQSL